MQMKLEAIEHARFRALAQIIVDKEKGVSAFEEYMKIAFPYLEATKKRDRKDVIERLQKEISNGPIAVTPVKTPNLKSKVAAARAARGSRTNPQTSDQEKSLYRKIGRHL